MLVKQLIFPQKHDSTKYLNHEHQIESNQNVANDVYLFSGEPKIPKEKVEMSLKFQKRKLKCMVDRYSV